MITSLSLVSISLPVAAIIVLLSVFNGFGALLSQINQTVDPDISIRRNGGNLFKIEEIDSASIASIEGVEALSFVAEQSMLFRFRDVEQVVTLRGVDNSFCDVVPLDKSTTSGKYEVALGELDRMVIGNALAYKLGIRTLVDSFVDVYSLNQNSFSSLLPISAFDRRKIKLRGVYSADMQSEERYAFTSLRAVQELLSAEGGATHIFVKADPEREAAAIEELRTLLGDDYLVESRYDRNPMIYDIVDYEKWGVLFMSLLVMALASFSLIGALSMLIIEKRGDLLTLRSMGASWRFIRRIFFGEGVLISSVGVLLGCVIGSSLTLLQQWYGVVKIPTQTLLINVYPVQLMWGDVLLTATLAMVISVALSYIVVRQMIKNS